MKNALRIFAIFLFSIFIFNQAQAYITKSGNVSSEYWSYTNTYYVDGDLTVDDGATFEIQAGTIVKFAHGTDLTVFGTLIANGNPGYQIFFTSKNDNTVGEVIAGSDGSPLPGDWGQIFFNGSGDYDGICQMERTTISYGGGTGNGNIRFYLTDAGYLDSSTISFSANYGIHLHTSSLPITGMSIHNNNNTGIYVSYSSPTISNCEFTNNDGYAAYMHDLTEISSYTNNSGSGNTINAFGISGVLNQNFTLAESICGFPYVLVGQLTVNDDYTLTIPAGEVIKGKDYSARILAYGTMNVIGTSADPIVFTSLYDDTYGGDLNGDGSATTPSPGNWKGLYIEGNYHNGTGYFDHCRIRYAGSSNYSAVEFNSPDDGYFKNSIVENSIYGGVQTKYANFDASNNQLLNNGSNGWYSSGSNLVLDNCIFNNNGSHGIYASGDTIQINNCQFNNNGSYAAYLYSVNVKTYTNNLGAGNTINAFGISGNVEQNFTLAESVCGFPYVLIGQLTIEDDYTLTIPPGEVIKGLWNTSAQIYVYGTISAIGTAANPIIFTSLYDDTYGGDLNGDGNATTPVPGNWRGLYIQGYYHNGTGYFDYCRIRYAGSSNYSAIEFNSPEDAYFKNSIVENSPYTGVVTRYANFDASNNQLLNNGSNGWYSLGSNLVLDNSIFNNNGSRGITAGGDTLQINNCQFNNNGSFAAYLSNVDVKTYTNNTGSGNTINAFGISGTVEQNLTLAESVCGFPYVIIGELTLADDYTLTIPAGEVIKAEDYNDRINALGTISAIGTSANPIVFTSLYDDSYGGDWNSDGDATTPSPGNWGGLFINGDYHNGIGWFDHCRVRYGGYSGNGYSSVNFNYPDDGYFKNSVVEYSEYSGVYTRYASFDASNNQLLNNGTHGWHSSLSNLNLDNSIFNNNGNNGIHASNDTLQINNCQFNNNRNFAAYLSYVNIKTYTNNTGSGNTINAFGISGTVKQNLTLAESVCGFPYVLNGQLSIEDAYTLTIPAGEVIKAEDYNDQIYVHGTISAIGTTANPIVFTSLYDDTYGGDLNGDGEATTPASGNWGGLIIHGYGDDDGIGWFDHCRIRYGGTSYNDYTCVFFNYPDDGFFKNSVAEYSEYSGIYTRYARFDASNNQLLNNGSYGWQSSNSNLNLDNSIFNNNGNNGINAGNDTLQINNCQFNNNGSYAAYLSNVDVKTYTNNTGSGNTINAFGISGTIKQNLTLAESVSGFPYVLTGALFIEDGYTLTIPAGEVVKALDYGARLYGHGTINAIGTSTEPIVFTSLYDDTFGGDLNGDGNATTASPGDWGGLYIYGYGDHEGIGWFDHCKVRFGGYSSNGWPSVYFNYPDTAGFINGSIDSSLTSGMQISNSGMIVRNSTFQGNNNYGIHIAGSIVPDLGQNNLTNAGLNTFISNNGGNIQLYNSSPTDIDAYYNDWGFYTETEIDENIYDDDENSGFGEVHFNPWYDPTSPPIEASFGADTLLGRAPLTVQFYDSTLLESNSWQWDFDNDGVIDATGQNPNMDFMQEGLYSVKLTASNGINNDILVRQNYINVSGEQSSQSLHFDGVDDFLKVDAIPFPSDDHTIEAWIYPTSLNGFHEVVFFYDNFGGVQFRIHDDASLLYGESVSGSWNFVISPPNSFEINEWTHVAVTKQGDNCTLFINGLNVGFNQFDNNPVPDTMSIGARSKYMDRLFEGNIDEVRIWTVARTQSEIQASISNYLNGDETGLYVYYRNNEGLGQKTYDLSDQVFHGQLGSTSTIDANDPTWIPTNWPYEATFKLDLRAFLEGPFNGSGMNTDLHEMLPLVQPYNVTPWDYDGTETFAGIFDTTSIVDWMLVEFRDAPDAASATESTTFEKQAAFMLEDGRIVGVDGSSNLRFNHFLSDQLYISVNHRNHVSVLAADPVPNNSMFFNYDFTSSAEQAYGVDAQTEIANNNFGMIGGDANADGTIDENDRTIWAEQSGENGYYSGDFNMDGQVQNVDKNEVWTNIGIPAIELPSVTTSGITDIFQTSASGGGDVTNNGGAAVTVRGICWSLISSPTLADVFTTDGNGTGSFTSSLSGLNSDTEYFVRAYATNSEGTAYGNEISFTTLPFIYLPTVATVAISDITETTATGGGNVTDDGGDPVTARGICWNLISNPTLADDFTTDGTGTGSFVSSLTGLNPDTEYFVRAYATNSEGTVYGNELSFTTLNNVAGTTCPGVPTVTDNDGNTYNTVLIGNQCWMAENLNVGTMIDVNIDQGENSTIEKYCYDNVQANCDTYGGLYQWNELMEYTSIEGTKGICPEGWHVPTYSEWDELNNFVELDGNALKAVGQGTNLGAGTNTSGFLALLGGNSFNFGFENMTTETTFWNSTNQTYSFAYRNTLSGTIEDISGGTSLKSKGHSLRCIQNSATTWECTDPLIDDRDDQSYNTVEIDDQCWMAENLNIGTMINYTNGGSNGDGEQTDNGTIEKYCYNDLGVGCDSYGGLYQWNEAMQYSNTEGAHGLCPTGWHIPTDAEWTQLEQYLGGVFVAGGKMKEAGTLNWISPNTGATNESGLTVLPSGRSADDGEFWHSGEFAFIWSSTMDDAIKSWYRRLQYFDAGSYSYSGYKEAGLSIRCLKN